MKINKKKIPVKSFTLIEVMVVVALTVTLFSTVVIAYQSTQTQAQLEATTSEIMQNLRQAQYLTLLGKDEAIFGLHVELKKYVFFKNTYLAENTTNEKYELPPTLAITNISLSGLNEITFSRPKGIPNVFGTFKIKAVNGQEKTIKINEVGMVQWE